MYLRWFILTLLVVAGNSTCVKNQIQLWSPTRCEAGRTFFAKLSDIPAFSNKKLFQPYLFPWLAKINTFYAGQPKMCTGALINDRYILTVQHCVLPPLRENHITVHLGYLNGYKTNGLEVLQPRMLERSVLRIIGHPYYDRYNPKTAANDLALLKIDPVKYSKTIYPIQLPTILDKYKNPSGLLGENIGWFVDNFGNAKNTYISVKLWDAQKCSSYDSNYNRLITPGVLCSSTVNSDFTSCGNENGGLLMVRNNKKVYNVTILAGIAAWNPSNRNSCEYFGPPTVYVRIDNKLEWIKYNTRDGLYCSY